MIHDGHLLYAGRLVYLGEVERRLPLVVLHARIDRSLRVIQ